MHSSVDKLENFEPDTLEGTGYCIKNNNKYRKNDRRSKRKRSKTSDKLGGQVSIDDLIKEAEMAQAEVRKLCEKPDKVVDIPRAKNEFIARAQTKVSMEYEERMKKLKESSEHPYRPKKSMMTEAEKKLYNIMIRAFNSRLACIDKSIVIFPMVRLADFIEIKNEAKYDKSAFLKIAYKHVDFLVCDSESLNILFAVELDDDYHNRPEKIERDKFIGETFRDCGIQLFRVKEKIKFVNDSTISNIIDYLLELYAPVCPVCGAKTTLKISHNRKNFGHRFYGCTKWRTKDDCGYNLSIE